MQALCIELASQAADRLKLKPVGGFSLGTPLHRRAVFANLENGNALGLKGCGWTLGPPYALGSQKDAELWLGLLDESSGFREAKVSATLLSWGVNCSRIAGVYRLTQTDLDLLGISTKPKFTNGKAVNPVILATCYKTQFRIADCTGPATENWYSEFDRLNPSKDRATALKNFSKNLARSILTYQTRGAVNDTLGPENITLGGEITDFEWIYIPGVPLPNGQSDEILKLRQAKEWIYFLESIHALAFNLSVKFSISNCITWAQEEHQSLGAVQCGFIDAANEMGAMNDNSSE